MYIYTVYAVANSIQTSRHILIQMLPPRYDTLLIFNIQSRLEHVVGLFAFKDTHPISADLTHPLEQFPNSASFPIAPYLLSESPF
jgi:hypothetical protein